MDYFTWRNIRNFALHLVWTGATVAGAHLMGDVSWAGGALAGFLLMVGHEIQQAAGRETWDNNWDIVVDLFSGAVGGGLVGFLL